MNYSDKITKRLKAQGVKKTWLAQNLLLRYEEFWEKMKKNSFTKEEKRKIETLLGDDSKEKINLMKKARVKNQLKELMEVISS